MTDKYILLAEQLLETIKKIDEKVSNNYTRIIGLAKRIKKLELDKP